MQPMCAICRHSQRQTIDQNLRAGRDLRTLADEFGVRASALRHHRDAHVLQRGRQRRPRRVAPLMH